MSGGERGRGGEGGRGVVIIAVAAIEPNLGRELLVTSELSDACAIMPKFL